MHTYVVGPVLGLLEVQSGAILLSGVHGGAYACMKLPPLCVWSVNVGVWTGSGLGEGLMYCVCEYVSECVDVHVFNGVYIWCMYIVLTILSA